MIVLTSIHGVGFQHAPSTLAASDGYADAFHERLRAVLGARLGDDPRRVAAGGRGPVYVQSDHPPHSGATEPGLARLGRWNAAGGVEADGVPLAGPGAAVAHVALVYSGLEEGAGDLLSLLGLELLSAGSVGRYASPGGLARMLLHNLIDRLHRGPRPVDNPPATSPPPAAIPPGAAGAATILRIVEDDVAAYVTRNEHRERVRGFLRDALSRLVLRPDLDGTVVNAHSNGTVMIFDVLAALSPASAPRVRALITAGSPLRKYVDLLDWGRDAGSLRLMAGSWTNVWDRADPVADPLAPPVSWRRGDPLPENGPGLFIVHDPDTGAQAPRPLRDALVDNVRDSSGESLRAHNYWDNPAVAELVGSILTPLVGTAS